jgi:hypothetical protein
VCFHDVTATACAECNIELPAPGSPGSYIVSVVKDVNLAINVKSNKLLGRSISKIVTSGLLMEV